MIPDVRIRFTFDGDDRTLTFVEVPLWAWSDLRRAVDLKPKSVMAGLEDGDVDSLVAMVWLERICADVDVAKFETFRDSLTGSADLSIVGLAVGPKTLFGEFGGDDDDPPTSGTG